MALVLGAIAALTIPQRWPLGPQSPLWLGLGGLGLIAALNYGWQYPTPSVLDISHVLQPEMVAGAQQAVEGRLADTPKISRSGKGQFWLQTQQMQLFDENDTPLRPPTTTKGKLYVTVPAEAIQDLRPGQTVKVQGKLYEPSVAKNPNAFDFKQYLASQGAYAGFSGRWVDIQSEAGWGLWQIRQRIVQAHRQGLGPDPGSLVSAMALGRQAVQVPYDLQDAFIQAGLAHTLAASGFQVSLLLGLVMGILRLPVLQGRLARPGLAQLIIGSLVLGGFVLMTGAQPSVMRAVLMGLGALIGLALERSVKPLGCLLLTVMLLLVWNPTWIDDVGFRLSVMATLGLMVSVKPITERLNGLPPTLSTLLAVPIAAYFWTIPLSLYYFNTLTTYSIVLNMVVTPLVTVISLGGMVTGLVALVLPALGSALAFLLGLPTALLIALVHWEISLPGSTLAMGHIALWQMIGLYLLYGLGGWSPLGRRRRWAVALLIVVTALGPLWYRGATLSQVAVLAAGNDAVMVVQDHRSTLLINSGTDSTAFYTVGPFLRQAGINRLNHAIDGQSSDDENWKTLIAQTPIQRFYYTHPLRVPPQEIQNPTRLGRNQILILEQHRIESLLDVSPVTPGLAASARPALGTALKLTLFHQHPWLMLTHLSQADQRALLQSAPALASDVLWWDGQPLQPALLEAIHPRIAIASTRNLAPEIADDLKKRGIQVWCTEQDGAILWQPRQGYQAYLATSPPPQTAWD
jgi:competence protein ComEC